ncbi:MAG: M48 family metallopeptidase [Nitrospira sp.]|nr:MAG: M48 family metallopeptidase [Nitrospira sp.]
MKYGSILGLASATMFLFMTACDQLPIAGGGIAGLSTAGQSTLNSPVLLDKLGKIFYADATNGREKYTAEASKEDKKVTDQMTGIFDLLIDAAKHNQKYGAVANEMAWQLTTIKDKAIINAKAVPGGGIIIYDGVFKPAQNEAGLAALLGHEMVHVLARHGLKRLAGSAATAAATIGPLIASGVTLGNMDPEVIGPVAGALGVGAAYGVHQQWEQLQEHDADCDGLLLAAEAGYNPEEINTFWGNMAKLTEEQKKTIQFLADHPMNDDRLAHIKKECLPNAGTAYNNRVQKLQATGQKKPNSIEPLPGVAG